MSYRVVIPTAGIGSRLGNLTKYINKSLVSIAHRPTISHLVEQFPLDCEFVIALGHKGQLVKDFLELAYPHRTFHFAQVDPFEGPGSGLGYSLLCCAEYLSEPFIFLSCDTLVKETIPAPTHDWMGYAEVEELSSYRTLEVSAEKVQAICEKGEIGSNLKAYIGLAGVFDHQRFWDAMKTGGEMAVTQGEAHGMRKILSFRNIEACPFHWFDTGNPTTLQHTRDAYREEDEPNILEKENEAIWFVGERVIKFSDDVRFIANRVQRVRELSGYIPKMLDARENMYCYAKVQGKILSEAVSLPLFAKLLNQCKEFWEATELTSEDRKNFEQNCHRFYYDKTKERVELFYSNFKKTDGTERINDEEMPTLRSLFDGVDWHDLANGLPGRFHGDFHFENILWSADTQKFAFLDWRQDFAGDLIVGDVYYDLAKLLHGLIVCHELIAKNQYQVRWREDLIEYDLHRKQILVECEAYLEEWCKENGFSWHKVRVLTALIYLNIAALHHHPYCELLYALGKRMLKSEME